MGCLAPPLHPQFLYKCINPKSKPPSPRLPFHPSFHVGTTSFICCNNLNNSTTTTVKQTKIPQPDAYNVNFKSMRSCKLGISRFPDFDYNAEGGSGSGTSSKTSSNAESDCDASVVFNVQDLYVPPLSSATAKFLGLPLPPFLRIDIVPEAFHGRINQESGKVELKFRAEFWFSVGSVYKAPPLLVDTVLTTEESKGKMRGGKGERLNKDGTCRLVGVATVEPINDIFMDTFLGLPTECLADLNAVISFSGM